jgi:hypothetical protein
MRWGHRIAARLGLDGNPLRRSPDKIAAWVNVGLVALFLVGAPVATIVVAHSAYQTYTTERLSQRSWHQVSAVVLNSDPVQGADYDGYGASSWAIARWAGPRGHSRVEVIPVPAYEPRGSHVRIWVNCHGQWSGPPVSRDQALLQVALATAAVPFGVVATLFAVFTVLDYLLDRRRLAAWDTDWAATGPQWTKQFRSHGG